MKKKIITIVIAICLIIATVPTVVFAGSSAHAHCICGGNISFGAHDTHTNIEWEEWNSTDSLPAASGNYYLANDINITAEQIIKSNINICLNGKTIKSSENYKITVYSNASLTITDCGNNGKLECSIENSGSFNMYNGTLQNGYRLITDPGTEMVLSGNSKFIGNVITTGDAKTKIEGNTEIQGTLFLSEITDDCPAYIGESAKVTGEIVIEQSQENAKFQIKENGYVHLMRGATSGEKIKLYMTDNSVVDIVKNIILLEKLSDYAKLGSIGNDIHIGGHFNVKDNAQIIGSNITVSFNDDSEFVIPDNVSITGDVLINGGFKADEIYTFKMQNNASVNGSIKCEQENLYFEMNDDAKINGDIELNDSKVSGKVICNGNIISGIFNGDVENNGNILGGTFFGNVTGNGTIADSAKVEITLNLDGGKGENKQYVLKGQKLTLPTPIKDGYTFSGWYSGENKYDFSKSVLTPFSLTAHWVKNPTVPTTEPATQPPTTTQANEPATKPATQSESTTKISSAKSVNAVADYNETTTKSSANKNTSKTSPNTGNSTAPVTSLTLAILLALAFVIFKKKKQN